MFVYMAKMWKQMAKDCQMGVPPKKEARENLILSFLVRDVWQNCSILFRGVQGCVFLWNLFFIMLMRSAVRHASNSFQL